MADDDRPPPDPAPVPSRDERLAAKLRENLRRRKLQARDMAHRPDDHPGPLPKFTGKS